MMVVSLGKSKKEEPQSIALVKSSEEPSRFEIAARYCNTTVAVFEEHRKLITERILAETGENVSERLGPELLSAYHACSDETREMLIKQTIRNILSLAASRDSGASR